MGEKRSISQNTCFYLDSKGILENTVSGTKVELSKTEFKILDIFVSLPNKAVTLNQLAQALWLHDTDHDTESIKPQISKIRQKMNRCEPGLGNLIVTNHGFSSYTFKPDSPISCEDAPTQVRSGEIAVDPSAVFCKCIWDLKHLNMPGTEIKYTEYSVAQMLVANDQTLYSGIPDELEGQADNWASFLKKFPETFGFLIDRENAIIGNFSFCALTLEQAKRVACGAFLERDFWPETTADLTVAGRDLVLYILNFSVNDGYRTVKNRNLLRSMFFNQLLYFAENDIFFQSAIINVFDPAQLDEFKNWGFTEMPKRDGVEFGRLYELKLRPYPDSLHSTLSKSRLLRPISEQLKEAYSL